MLQEWPQYCCPPGFSADIDTRSTQDGEWASEPSALEMTAAHTEAQALGLKIRQSSLPGATLGLYKRTRGEPGDVIGNLWGWQVFATEDPTQRFPGARYHPLYVTCGSHRGPPGCASGVGTGKMNATGPGKERLWVVGSRCCALAYANDAKNVGRSRATVEVLTPARRTLW